MAERTDWTLRRANYVEVVIWPEIQNKLVLSAFQKVRQEDFLPTNRKCEAYTSTIQLRHGSSITDPKLTAQMMDHLGLTGYERVLEIGTATGFSAALLSCCGSSVDTIEYQADLAQSAKRRLTRLGYTNITVHTGDGAQGLPDKAPFDAILVTAAARQIPEKLVEQIAEGGRMIVPVGRDPVHQILVVVHKGVNNILTKDAGDVQFHPLISTAHGGWTTQEIQEANNRKWAQLLKTATDRCKSQEELIAFLAKKFGVPAEKVKNLIANVPDTDIPFLLIGRDENGGAFFEL